MSLRFARFRSDVTVAFMPYQSELDMHRRGPVIRRPKEGVNSIQRASESGVQMGNGRNYRTRDTKEP